MDNLFDEIANFYDLLYEDKDTINEVAYINKLINRFSKNVNSILELGSGTGRHGIALSEFGYEIYGIEKSRKMVEASKKNVKFSIHEGDIRDFRLSKKFDCAIALFHVLSYLSENDDLESFFRNVNKHLNPSGILIFDFWYAPAVISIKPSVRIKTLSNKDYCITRIANPEISENLNKVLVKYDFLVEDKKTGKLLKFKEDHPMRYFSLPEIELFASKAGFKLINSEEWLSCKKPSFDSWGVCVVLEKI